MMPQLAESRAVASVQPRSNICGAQVFRDGIPQRKILPAGETWWGAVNAVTGWVDHLQPVAGDRYAYALLGSGDKLKSAALTRAVDLCS